ncbi:hypothetical protein I3760_07G093700 [Carya illinoinensis]|nr:hypothetical protein I3760_07G093700 [Carya illinoinensis]
MPHAWLPLFVPRPDANPSAWTSQGNLLPPFHSSVNPSIGLHSASSSHVVQIQKATPDSWKVESLSTPSVPNTIESKDDDKSGTQNIVHIEGGR